MNQPAICAYHNHQQIINFCKCKECLLPVCSICVKVHLQQHKINRTNPKFQGMDKVVDQIRFVYEQLLEGVRKVRVLMMDVESDKKEHQDRMRKRLEDSRKRVLKQFEKIVEEQYQNVYAKMFHQDEKFIDEMQVCDSDLSKLEKIIKRDFDLFHKNSKSMLKTVIEFHSQDNEQRYSRQLEQLNKWALKLSKKKNFVKIQPSSQQKLKNLMREKLVFEAVE